MTASKSPIIDKPSKEEVKELTSRPYQDISIEGLDDKIEVLAKFFEDHGINYDKFQPEHLSIKTDKKAYPNYDQYMHIPGQHNLQKWLETVRKLYAAEKGGLTRVDAIRQATNGWNIMETYDFLNWLKFYQEGAHLKYKTAQLWYENGQPGYFLQIKPDAPKPEEEAIDHHAVDEVRESAERQEEKKRTIEKQRQKIIGRLDSAEKLLRSPEGQMFAGPEMESLMEAIFNLKKKVQLVNKLSSSIRLYEDMIFREGNVLRRKGFIKAAEVLYSLSQANNPPPPGIGVEGPINVLPPPVSPDDPSGAGHPGAPGGLPSLGPGMPQPPKNPPSTSENQPFDPKSPDKLPDGSIAQGPPPPIPQDNTPKGIAEFLEGTETAGKTTSEDEHGVEDELDIEDTLEVEDEMLMVSEAQMGPPAGVEDVPMTTRPSKPKPAVAPAPEAPLEVTEEDIPPPRNQNVPPSNIADLDEKIDDAFKNASMEQIIQEMEAVARIFRIREIPRRIARIDMMLNAKGIASLFPTLSEILTKQLDASNYCSTRAEDILSRLRGTIKATEIDVEKENAGSPEMTNIKNKLQQDQDKEIARKQQRKEMSDAELANPAAKETPQVNIKNDLAPPAPPKPVI